MRRQFVGLFATCLTAAILFSIGCGERKPWKGPQQLVFRAPDGVRLMASLWKPRSGRAPVVLAIANPEQDRGAFRRLAETLAERGVATLALDLRIQGESLQANRFADPLSPEHLRYLTSDVSFVLKAVRGASYAAPNRLGLIACSHNAEIALRAALGDTAVKAVALLSPVLTDSLLTELVGRRLPVFAASSYDDPAGAPITKRIGEESHSPDTQTKVYFAAGVGSDMLWGPEGADLINRLSTWFARVLEAGAE